MEERGERRIASKADIDNAVNRLKGSIGGVEKRATHQFAEITVAIKQLKASSTRLVLAWGVLCVLATAAAIAVFTDNPF
ncbi:hypothetical protein SB5439_05141 [Klebsiella variicola]|nr:hypothetical protein SB5439_05141 [Klebsiella variicola]